MQGGAGDHDGKTKEQLMDGLEMIFNFNSFFYIPISPGSWDGSIYEIGMRKNPLKTPVAEVVPTWFVTQ
jgi:hypothetical protein